MRAPSKLGEVLAEAEQPAAEEPEHEIPPKLEELDVSAPRAEAPAEAPLRLPGLGMARIVHLGEAGEIEISIGGRTLRAEIDPIVHVAVLKTAFDRGEPVLVEDRGGTFAVVGALRTQPTPGIDAMSTVTIEAERIELKAKEEITMSSGVAAVALRAIGEVETYADRIMSRAESVHKIIGRMLRLN